MIVELGGGYRLRTYDARNLVLERFRRPSKGDGEARWFSCDRYFPSVPAAMRSVIDMRLMDSADEVMSIAEAVRRMGEIAEDAAKSVRDSLAKIEGTKE